MPNIKVKYIIDENGDRVAPVTHIDAVRDSDGNGLGTILESKADSTDISDLQDLIPAQASANNQLADKEFVNSSVSTATATYRGCYNLVSDLSLTTQASHGLIETALASAVSDTPDNNDYAFVQIPTDDSTPTEIASVERYKFNGTLWSFEYTLNNSGFTAAQWAALNSNITSGLVAKLNSLSTNNLSTITKLFGMDSNGNFLNISTNDLASVLGVGGGFNNFFKPVGLYKIGIGSVTITTPFKHIASTSGHQRFFFPCFCNSVGNCDLFVCSLNNYSVGGQESTCGKLSSNFSASISTNSQSYATITINGLGGLASNWVQVSIPWVVMTSNVGDNGAYTGGVFS